MNEFEEWALSKELSITKNPNAKKFGVTYWDIETEMFWECWKAAQLSPRLKYWQHGETGRVCVSVLQPSERWYETTQEHYEAVVRFFENAEVKSDE